MGRQECGVQLGFVGMYRMHNENSNEGKQERLGFVGVGVEGCMCGLEQRLSSIKTRIISTEQNTVVQLDF